MDVWTLVCERVCGERLALRSQHNVLRQSTAPGKLLFSEPLENENDGRSYYPIHLNEAAMRKCPRQYP